MGIDRARLPELALIDTGVLIRATEDRQDDADRPACLAFWDAMLDSQREVLVSAATVAEVVRGGGSPPPRRRNVTVVPFDAEIGMLLGEKCPQETLQRIKEQECPCAPGAYFKYDAMIVATALRFGAVLVALDRRSLRSLAKVMGVEVRVPSYYEAPPPAQSSLFDPKS